MKRSLCVVSVLVVLVGGSLPVAATTFTGVFSGAAEDPPNDSPGTGTAEVELNPDENLLRVDVTFSGLEGLTTVAHIHCCAPPGEGAGVATTVPTFPGFPADVTSGSYQMSFDTSMDSTFNPAFIAANGGTAEGAEAALLAGLESGMAYFNIHTTMFEAGEIRADLSSGEPATPTETPADGTPTDTPGEGTPTETPTSPDGPPTATGTPDGASPTPTEAEGTPTATTSPVTPAGTATATAQTTGTPTGQATGSPTGGARTSTPTPPGGSPTTTSGTRVATATGSPVRTATTRPPVPSNEDDGCGIVSPQRSGSAWILLLPAALLLAARRRRA